VKTSNDWNSGTDDGVFIQLCNTIFGQCCETQLDDPNKNDFQGNALDTFTNNLLSPCEGFQVSARSMIRMRISGDDGWLGKYVKLSLEDGRTMNCPIDDWIDNSNEKTLSCTTS